MEKIWSLIVGGIAVLLLLFFIVATRLSSKNEKSKVYLLQPVILEKSEKAQKIKNVEWTPKEREQIDFTYKLKTPQFLISGGGANDLKEIEVVAKSFFQPKIVVVNPQKFKTKERKSSRRTLPIKTRKTIQIKELDKKPQILSMARFKWPRQVRSLEVKALLTVRLNKEGGVELLKIKSLSNGLFRRKIPNIIKGIRFTSPTVQGKKVSVVYDWPLILRRP